MKNWYPNISTLVIVLIVFFIIPIVWLVFDSDGEICDLLLRKCKPQSAQIFYILLICTGFLWWLVEIIQHLRWSLDEESIIDSKYLSTWSVGLLTMIDDFSKRENSWDSLEWKIKLYWLTIFFFIAWWFLAYCFYVIQPNNIIQAIVAGLMFTWVIWLYPLVRCITYFNERLQDWIDEE